MARTTRKKKKKPATVDVDHQRPDTALAEVKPPSRGKLIQLFNDVFTQGRACSLMADRLESARPEEPEPGFDCLLSLLSGQVAMLAAVTELLRCQIHALPEE